MLARLADKLVLRPTRHAISTVGRTRRLIRFSGGCVEAWSQRRSRAFAEQPELYILKFPGTGGRAECMTDHPAECWGDCTTEVWAVNPPGYGGSSGRASMRMMAAAARAAFREIRQAASGRPIVVTGNSLGTAAALHLAATCRIDGLLLRNPPPLRQLIMGRFGWWNLGLGAALIARQVPVELDSIANAAKSRVPAVIVSSGKDRIVPPRYQQQVIEAYAGEKRILVMPNADHANSLDEEQAQQYAEMLNWLRRCIAQQGRSLTTRQIIPGRTPNWKLRE